MDPITEATFRIQRFTPAQTEQEMSQLADLLVDAVDGGASVGYLPPLAKSVALAYWQDVATAVSKGSDVLLVALEPHRILGAVQLALETRPNGEHRAEVRKLIVHRRARRRGVAKALMAELQTVALKLGRTLLLLDTQKGSEAEKLFDSLGYVRFGEVPHYARSGDRSLHATVFFYRQLK